MLHQLTDRLIEQLKKDGFHHHAAKRVVEVDHDEYHRHVADLKGRVKEADLHEMALFHCLTMNQNPPVVASPAVLAPPFIVNQTVDNRSVERMLRVIIILLGVLVLLLIARPAHAQNVNTAKAVTLCGNQSLTAGDRTFLTTDLTGNLCISGGGGGGGGTSSNFTATFPTAGTAVGFKDLSGNMQAGLLDGSGYIETNCVVGCAGAADTVGTTVSISAASPGANSSATVAMAGQRGATVTFASGTIVATIYPEISYDNGGHWSSAQFTQAGTGATNQNFTFLSNPSNAAYFIIFAGAVTNVRVVAYAYTSGSVNTTLRAVSSNTATFLYVYSNSLGANVSLSGSNEGALTAGARVNTSAPSYGDATDHILAMTTAGALRSDIDQVNGTTVATNTGSASAGTLRVVLATDQPQLTQALKVDGSAITQPVSGTVTANAGSGTFSDQHSNITTDYDTGAGTQTMTMFGIALPASGGSVAGGTSSNPLRVDPTGVTTQPVSGTFWQATQPVSGTFWQATQPVSIADGSSVTLGAKGDAKSTATDTTAISIMSVLKEISFMEQTPASRAVTNAGTFAVQAASTIADGADVTQGAKADARSTSTDATAVTVMSVLKEISFMAQAPASTPVTGTFWQATQPVSGAVTATDNITQWNSVALGSPSAYGTSPGAVNVTGVNAFVTNVPHMICDAGCTPGGSFADSSAFSFGVTAVNPTAFVVDEIATNVVAENASGTARMSSSRVAYAALTDPTGNPLGSKANPVTVSNATDKSMVSSSPGAPPASSQLIAGRYSNLIAPLSTGQTVPVQMDRYGRTLVNVQASQPIPAQVQDASGVRPVFDACQSFTKQFGSASITTSTQIITGAAGRRVVFCSWNDQLAGTAQNYAVVEGTGGASCPTNIAAVGGLSGGTTAATGWNVAANGGRVITNGGAAIGSTTTPGNNVCVLLSGSIQTNVGYSYVLAP